MRVMGQRNKEKAVGRACRQLEAMYEQGLAEVIARQLHACVKKKTKEAMARVKRTRMHGAVYCCTRPILY